MSRFVLLCLLPLVSAPVFSAPLPKGLLEQDGRPAPTFLRRPAPARRATMLRGIAAGIRQ